MKITRVLPIFVAACAATVCVAGTLFHYKCDTPACNFEGDLGVGGGFIFEKATGYCTNCRKFVSLRWKRQGLTGDMKKFQDTATNLLKVAPKQVGTVWNPSTGLTVALYPCPDCKQPFMEIESVFLRGGQSNIGNLTCPSCTNLTLQFQRSAYYD